MYKCVVLPTSKANKHLHHPNVLGKVLLNVIISFLVAIKLKIIFNFSLLSTSRDSTYREDDSRNLLVDELNTNGRHFSSIQINKKPSPTQSSFSIKKSSSCSSFLIDILFRGICHRSKIIVQNSFFSCFCLL